MIIPWQGKQPTIGSHVFVAPTATLIGDVTIEDGASIWFGAVLRGDFGAIRIGRGANVQDNVVVHTSVEQPTVVLEGATLGHGSVIEACTIGRRAVIGINAVVLNGATVGDECMVAAGSIVGERTQIPPRHLAAGAPAQVKKELSGSSLEWIAKAGPEYQELAALYLEESLGATRPGR